MFYLINEKDGLTKEQGSILVNANLLTVLDSGTGNRNTINVHFHFSNKNKFFSFNKDNCFNVNQVMQNLSQLNFEHYSNCLITFTDIENIHNLKDKQFYLHKFSNILVNLHRICLVYKHEKKGSLIMTPEKNIFIQESPEEVFHMINSRISH